MMKILVVIFLLSLPFTLLSQSEIAGVYKNYFFSEIRLNSDSTFQYGWYNDLHGAWAKGRWTLKEDTVYFHKISMYDTVSVTENDGSRIDSLILSHYSKQRRLTAEMLSGITVESIEQNGGFLTDTMLCKENRLYEIKNGILVMERQRVGRRSTERDPWYFKLPNE